MTSIIPLIVLDWRVEPEEIMQECMSDYLMTSIIQLIVLDWRVEPEERMQECMSDYLMTLISLECLKGPSVEMYRCAFN